ncbi:MAG: hypothetical protein V1659_03410 [Candidatus Woesearchaeota archaeon]
MPIKFQFRRLVRAADVQGAIEEIMKRIDEPSMETWEIQLTGALTLFEQALPQYFRFLDTCRVTAETAVTTLNENAVYSRILTLSPQRGVWLYVFQNTNDDHDAGDFMATIASVSRQFIALGSPGSPPLVLDAEAGIRSITENRHFASFGVQSCQESYDIIDRHPEKPYVHRPHNYVRETARTIKEAFKDLKKHQAGNIPDI